jgi:plasmid stabilization system protein ParE
LTPGAGSSANEFVVELSPTAEADLERFFDFLLDPADTTEDLDRAQAAIEAIRATAQHRLAITPLSFRKAAQNPVQREFIIPFGGVGYVALHEIVSKSKVVVLAVRHQREEDCH